LRSEATWRARSFALVRSVIACSGGW
jgi:hypothetical protein